MSCDVKNEIASYLYQTHFIIVLSSANSLMHSFDISDMEMMQ